MLELSLQSGKAQKTTPKLAYLKSLHTQLFCNLSKNYAPAQPPDNPAPAPWNRWALSGHRNFAKDSCNFRAEPPVSLCSNWPHENWNLLDRKSTRLNSSHQLISYAVFCLKKKK